MAGKVERGILICGSGVGVCVAANKMPGVRAGMCHDTYSAHQGVEHDQMNVLVLGARIIGEALAYECVDSYLKANFIGSEERFVRRLNKVFAIEKLYMPKASGEHVDVTAEAGGHPCEHEVRGKGLVAWRGRSGSSRGRRPGLAACWLRKC